MFIRNFISTSLACVLLGSLPAWANDILTTDGFSTCMDNTGDLIVQKFNIQYDRSNMTVTFDVAGMSKKSQKVQAYLVVTAYGKNVYENSFDPCEQNVDFLCPVPSGNFSATGQLPIPEKYASMIPAIAFQVPDLDGIAKLTLTPVNGTDSGPIACLESNVQNGKTAQQPVVSWVTAGVAAGALVIGGASAFGAAVAGVGGHAGGSSGTSPNVGDVIFWFQSIATTGLLSVDYPPVYRAFTKNFAWSTGLIPWESMQKSIDTFRSHTGGNLALSSVEELANTTLIFTPDTTSNTTSKTKRSVEWASELVKRIDITTSVNGTTSGTSTVQSSNSTTPTKVMKYVKGLQAYVNQLAIPTANTFMTVLLIFSIVLASVAVLILLFKLILELYAMCGKLSKPLQSFRKRYWGFLGGTMVRIILIVYGVWTIYCLYQFRRGDSWAAHILAAVTLLLFTAILAFFAIRITVLAKRAKRMEGTPAQLFEDKKNLRRYGIFYDQYKATFWWFFIPFICYLFIKGAFIALGDGHGLIQSAGQIGCEVALLILLIIGRPFNTTAGNVINICISVARVISVVGVLVFTVELQITPTTKTVTGLVLIVVQSVVTAALAILIAVNAIIVCCKENPHVKKRHAAEKAAEEARMRDNLTPLDPRNSIIDPASYTRNMPYGMGGDGKGNYSSTPTHDNFPMDDYRSAPTRYDPLHHDNDADYSPYVGDRSVSPIGSRPTYLTHNQSQDVLINSASPMGRVPPSFDSHDNYRDHPQQTGRGF